MNPVSASRPNRSRPRARSPHASLVLAALPLMACVTEPGAPSDSDDEESSGSVTEVLSFREAPASVGFNASVSPVSGGELLGGMASADVDLDGTDDVFILGGSNGAKLLLNGESGFVEFADLPQFDPSSVGPLFADVDGDLDPDLVLPNAKSGAVELYLNDEGTSFELAKNAGFDAEFTGARGAVAGDVDGDGDLDLFILRDTGDMAGTLWLNDGGGHFSDASDGFGPNAAPGAALSALFFDSNADGRTDLALTRGRGVSLWLNETSEGGAPRFSLDQGIESVVAAQVERVATNGAFMVNAADLDNDADPDLLLTAIGGLDVKFETTPAPEADAPASGADAGESAAEADAGKPDSGATPAADASAGDAGTELVSDTGADASSNPSHDAAAEGVEAGVEADPNVLSKSTTELTASGRNLLLANDGKTFVEWPELTAADTGAGTSCIADFNNDGTLDVFQPTASADAVERVAKGEGSGVVPHLFLQSRTNPGTFTQLASPAGLEDAGEGRSVLCFDYDKDGDVDILIAPFEGPIRLFQNRLDPGVGPANYVLVRVVGSDEHPNVLGAVVTAVVGGASRTRVVGLDRVAGSQSPDIVHFGLGASTGVDGLFIAWPDGAEETLIEELPINSAHTVKRK